MKIRWRPRLRTVLVVVNLLILALPLGGIGALRLYENELIRRTEAELIGQGAFVAESWRGAIADQLGVPLNHPRARAWGLPCARAWRDKATPKRPLRARPALLDVGRATIQPRASNPKRRKGGGDPIAVAAGVRLQPQLQRATTTTLSAVRVVGPRGFVVATSRAGLGGWLGHWPEIARGLHGEPSSLLRIRTTRHRAPLESISRGTPLRVFVTVPVVERDRVLGVVVLSRTPMDVTKALYINRIYLASGAAALLAVVALVALLTSIAVNRPLRRLKEMARRVADGEPDQVAPIAHPGTVEIAELSDAIVRMARTLSGRAAYIEAFAGNVSHALKTPLTSIRGTVELLQDHLHTMEPAQADRFLANLAGDAERLERLVLRLMALARAGTVQPAGAAIDARTVIHAVAARWRDRHDDRITTEIAATPLHARVAPETLDSMVDTLVDNAFRHGGDDVQVHLSASPLADEPGIIEIAISDDGAGIDPAIADQLFEPFVTTAGDRGGSGLGLAIVRALAEGLGGSVMHVPSSPAGSRFSLRFAEVSDPHIS